jgi:hypothetical protein
MPIYEAPRSDMNRLAFLKQAATTGTQDIAAGKSYISQETLDALNALAPGFESAHNDVSARLSARSEEVRQSNEALITLQTYVRDLWEVLRRRVIRLNQPAAVLQFYGLGLDGINPNPTTQAQWLATAVEVIAGDAEAVAAGYPAMTNPSAAELQTILTAAQQEADQVAPADRAYDEAQEAVAALRPQADELIQDVMDELRFNLRKRDAPSQRRIMRTYGASFSYLPGEPSDPDDAGSGSEDPPAGA